MKCYHDYTNDKEFMDLIEPIIKTENFKLMREIPQHKNSTMFIHSVLVAYNCYLRAKDNDKYDLNVVVRGALLHDYFLYDWRKNRELLKGHGFNHPKIALENARKEYDLCQKEIDIILNHMWPLTLFHMPKSKEAWLVSRMDKKVTLFELRKKKITVLKTKLNFI